MKKPEKPHNPAAKALQEGQNQPKKVPPKMGKGSYRRSSRFA